MRFLYSRFHYDNNISWIKSLTCLKKCNMSIEEMKEYLSGNLCRCTGYENIVNAVEKVNKENLQNNE